LLKGRGERSIGAGRSSTLDPGLADESNDDDTLRPRCGARDQGGFVLPWMALMLLVLVAMAGFGVDVWHLWDASQKVPPRGCRRGWEEAEPALFTRVPALRLPSGPPYLRESSSKPGVVTLVMSRGLRCGQKCASVAR
jgi:hypothetical protein